jgi:hypothetical protein
VGFFLLWQHWTNSVAYNNNNNNQACQSQASWGRLELRPNKHRQLRFRNVNSRFPSTPIQT